MISRRKLFGSGLLLSLSAIFFGPRKTEAAGTVTHTHTFRFDPHLTVEQAYKKAESYFDYTALYLLDRQFQTSGKLLEIQTNKIETAGDPCVVIRKFANEASYREWQTLFNQKCILPGTSAELYSKNLKIAARRS